MGRHILRNSIAVGVVLVLWGAPLPVEAQEQVLVIQGGTLIDGNGGAPLANSVVVIRGNRISAVGQAGQVQVPAGAQVLDATGKWVLPGLWDNQSNYRWFFGELNLHQGVTSIVDVGNGEELSIVHRDAVNNGRIRGPRTWIGIGHMGGADPSERTGFETELSTRQIPTTVEETLAIARRLLDAGADMVQFHDGEHFTPAMVAAGCEEAHARGKVCTQRASGPQMWAPEAARAGVDVLPHARGIDGYVVRDGVDANNVLDRFAQMDEAKAQELIAILVEENVYPVPNFIHETPGYPRDWERQEAIVRQVLTDMSLRAYYMDYAYKELRRFRTDVDTGAVRERRMPGYRNMMRFYRMFDAAGGKTLVGGDTNASKLPGFAVKEEMEIFQEAGIPQMRIIQGATKWGAESLNKLDDLGTIEAGKLADILIVNADPLQNISNLRDIDNVIFDGRIVDRSFHSYYDTPFRGNLEDMRVVEGLAWTVRLKEATFTGGNALRPPAPDDSPQPAIQTITPVWATQGDPGVTIRLTGFNFVQGSRVTFDGVSVPWTWISPTELHVAIDENLLRRAGRFAIQVVNPQPMDLPEWGDGTSNTARFIVNFSY